MENLLQSKALILAVAACGLFALERAFPAALPRAAARLSTGADRLLRILKNLGLLLLNAGLSPLLVIPLSALAAQWSPDWRPSWTEGIIIDLLILDLWIYWWHRANHLVPFLWRFHEVHHLDEFLDVSSAVRFHFGEVVLSALVRATVIFALGIPFAHVVVFETVVLLAAMFHHSNVKLPAGVEGPLSLLIVTPSIHWVHHHALRRDTDSNYSTFLSVWDRLFTTGSATKRSPAMPIGVENRADEPLWRLVLRPFRPNQS